MSTAQTPQPQDPAPPPGRRPGAASRARWRNRPGADLWARRLAAGLVVGVLAWGVAALLGPGEAVLRQFTAALLCAAAAVAVQHVLALDRRVREQDRRTRQALAETASTVQDLLRNQQDELRTGLARATDDLRELVDDRLPEVRADALRLPERTDADGVPDLAHSFAEVLAPGPAILGTFVRMEMKRVVGHLSDLTNLTAECPGENHDWMLTLTRAAQHSICAISTSVDREFWNSEPASRYLQAQREVIEERGLPVRRLFLLQSARELNDRLLRLCDEQELLRIEVRVAVLPELPPHLQRGTTDDFIVYDEEVTFEIEQDLREVNVRTRLDARQDHVQDRMKRFRELWDVGMSVRELEVRVDDEEDSTWMVDRG
ncbi:MULTISPECIES: hypothetical protein [Streptomyces]|jgi:hypothetical protein|uniref:Uncharacterized protein n=2 Tax=Streptomyces TaxID=1883 RepID=A0ABT9LD67_STRGD|nr:MULTISPECIES: hypothetical protein [Streptomyces]MDP9681676.1 hypothetical protein [Streptomyces griseoviridis]GGS72869.1 hypothetical protein GCM10010240_02160 [Streptomyces griseoviridis]GGU34375.1 hypothetical protein GCM10010259_26190 [Streptomyces daghestanicus]GHI34327.1 hypothetical protein Sdagh_60570 [Streptomyces daghestanicus]